MTASTVTPSLGCGSSSLWRGDRPFCRERHPPAGLSAATSVAQGRDLHQCLLAVLSPCWNVRKDRGQRAGNDGTVAKLQLVAVDVAVRSDHPPRLLGDLGTLDPSLQPTTQHRGSGSLWSAVGNWVGATLRRIYDLIATTNWSTWLVWLVAWCVIGGWQGVFQDVGWDVWVAPEHDTPWSIKRKVPASHIPNVTITLTYLALYENRLIFIGLQSLALVAASIYMRFPKWNETEPILAPATEPAYLGLTRATGFITDDPDPYRTQRESDRRRSKTK